jgi:hypothetical protein
MFYTSINFNTINYLRDRFFYKDRVTLLILKELRHKDKIKRTYSQTVFNINKYKIKRVTLKARN